jgi:acetylserotonin N-methyltransferase
VTDGPPSDDALLYDVWLGYLRTGAVVVAHELGLFEALAAGARSTAELARDLACDERSVAAISGVLLALDFLRREGPALALTESARRFLLRASPESWESVLTRLRGKPDHVRIREAIRPTAAESSHLAHGGRTFTQMWEEGDLTPEAATHFTQGMHATIFAAAASAAVSGAFTGVRRMLDVGGGSGAFAMALTERDPGLTVEIFDLPAVCEAARGYFAASPAAARIELRPGNFFGEAWPQGHDGILFSNIFHDWSPEVCADLARRAYASLPPGGRVFAHEMLLDDDKCGPLTTACFSLLMHVNHASQQFSRRELTQLLEGVGFAEIRVIPTSGYYSVVTGLKR